MSRGEAEASRKIPKTLLGIETLLITFCRWLSESRKIPKTLLGIETLLRILIANSHRGRKIPKTLLGIETTSDSFNNLIFGPENT